MPTTLSMLPFLVLGLAMVFSAVMVMASRNVIHAAYWLLALSVSSAGIIWFLGAEFIATMQLLVYAGAVSVLIIFTIMITLRSYEDAQRPVDFSPGALVVALGFFSIMAFALASTVPMEIADVPVQSPELVEFGLRMYSLDGWVLPFEIASLVLLVALVGGVWWTRGGDR